MGHLAGKDIYNKLGRKVDQLALRAPMNDAFYGMLGIIGKEPHPKHLIYQVPPRETAID